ncbi:DUF685 domain-containing protein [Borreliella burgdorferi]|uniref:DUF685 domain-containing protein n=1 Tax=Borreliella burgdorferi TaxID=139 RepID=UPI001E30B74A|nr:DUF685 domain-containing protein [Borreliella burgdorferi]MCD2374420.1 DUF685 domain-containing protein [Borreliella burgdorferi]
MADDPEKLLIDEQETVQIKDLNKVTTVKNTDLLLLDDGAASSNAITFKNFLKTVNHQTFKGEELGYFKEIIKSTIATELAADNDFIKSIYDLIVDKLIENESSKLSNLFGKIKSRLTDSISSATLSRSDDLLIMFSSNIQKTPVPKQLLGIPSDFQYTRRNTYSTTIYWSDYSNKSITIDLQTNHSATILFYKSDDDALIYLDIDLYIPHQQALLNKTIAVRYMDETEKSTVYMIDFAYSASITIPIYKGWYVQKRAYSSGNPIPVLLKL